MTGADSSRGMDVDVDPIDFTTGRATEEVLQQGRGGRPRRRGAATVVSVAAVAVLALGTGGWLALRPGGSSSATATAELTGTDWVLAGMTGTTPPGTAPRDPHLQIQDGQISGTDGCNSFSGPVTIGAGRLEIGGLMTTAMWCAQEAPLDRYLTGTVTWHITGNRLEISKDGVGTLTYRPPRPSGPDDLVIRGWALEGIESGSVNSRQFQAADDSTLRIGRGRLTASTRCGVFVAKADVTATTLVVRDRKFLDHSCPSASPAQEQSDRFLTTTLRHVLAGTVPWSLTGDLLKVGAAPGPVLQYGAQELHAAPGPASTSRPR